MALATSIPIILFFIVGLCCSGKITSNVLRAGDRNPVLRLRQGYGSCTLLGVVICSIY
jgi:hypothetical protein